MKNQRSFSQLLLAAAATLGLASAAFAQQTVETSVAVDEPVVVSSGGLLGQTYAAATYGFIDLDDTGIDAHSFNLALNQYVRDGLDSQFEYDYSRTDRIAGTRLSQHLALIGARAYTNYNGFKPFAEVGLGWAWVRGFGNDDSFAWRVGVGAEFELTPEFSVAPLIRYSDAPDISSDGTWEYGARANYWLRENLALTGGLLRDDDSNMEYRIGVAFRY